MLHFPMRSQGSHDTGSLFWKDVKWSSIHCHLSSTMASQRNAHTSQKHMIPQATANIDKIYCNLK